MIQQHTIKIIHGRKKGRPLGKDRSAALSDLLPAYEISNDQITQDHSLNPAKIFSKPFSNFWLEIGFGQGEHLAGRLAQNPQIAYLGAEMFINGVAGFLQKIEAPDHNNIRIYKSDGLKLARSLTPHSLDGIYLLNPDPWHKKRHHKRRLINPENLDLFAKILKPEGQLILSTDVPYLADWMITQTVTHPAFTWTAKSAQDWQNPPENWISTRYESKGAKGAKKMIYLVFHKNLL